MGNLMPNTFARRSRWAFVLGVLLALAIVTTTLSVFVVILQTRVNELRAAERTAEVATCYGAARGRPGLIVILRVIAGLTPTAADREIINSVVDQYEGNTPTVEGCDMLARQRGLDPKDFPAPELPETRDPAKR